MRKIRIIASLGLVIAMLVALAGPIIQVAQASAITNASNTMSRLAANTLSNHEIRFVTPAGVAGGQTITVTFPAGFGMGSFLVTNVDFAATLAGQGCATPGNFTERTLAGTASGTTWGVGQVGQVITITSGTDTVPANACIRIRIGNNATLGGPGVNQIINHVTPGSYTIAIAGTFGNTGNIMVQILSNEQVLVSAIVPQAITFTISTNTVGFGTLSDSAPRFASSTTGSATETEAHNIVVGTNAANGYTMTASGTTLVFGANDINAIGPTNVSSAIGTEQFGLRMTVTGAGNGAVSPPYAATGFAFDTAAFPDDVASTISATATNTFSVRYLANIATLTPAGNYTATLTYIATANF